ncbi:MAG: hypothetical protein AMS18_05500, partial [Gemmatimonas sp. SG8_17]
MIALPSRSIIRFRAAILVFWSVAVALAWPRASRVDEALQVEGEQLTESETSRSRARILEAFPQPILHFFVVTVEGPSPIDSTPTRTL